MDTINFLIISCDKNSIGVNIKYVWYKLIVDCCIKRLASRFNSQVFTDTNPCINMM